MMSDIWHCIKSTPELYTIIYDPVNNIILQNPPLWSHSVRLVSLVGRAEVSLGFVDES